MENLATRIALADEALRLFSANCDEIAKEIDGIKDRDRLKRARVQWLKLVSEMVEQVLQADKRLDVKIAKAGVSKDCEVISYRTKASFDAQTQVSL